MQAIQQKCWFVLGQPYYPAPTTDDEGVASGPLLLGHLLPGPVAVGKAINRSGIQEFHDDMNTWDYPIRNFSFKTNPEQTTDVNVEVGLPLAAAAGITVSAGTGAFFRYATGTSWNIRQLDVSCTDPTPSYIDDVVRSSEVNEWIEIHKRLGAWELYMVTGLMIARGAQGETTRSTETGPHARFGVEVPTIATGALSAAHTRKHDTSISGEYPQDFVWAIRVSRISSGHFSKRLKIIDYTDGATLASSNHTRKEELEEVIAKELSVNDARTIEASWGWDLSNPEQHFFVTDLE